MKTETAKLHYASSCSKSKTERNRKKTVQTRKQCGETKFNKNRNEKNSCKQHQNSNKIIKMENLTGDTNIHISKIKSKVSIHNAQAMQIVYT